MVGIIIWIIGYDIYCFGENLFKLGREEQGLTKIAECGVVIGGVVGECGGR